jgi:LPS sulfotransferase NodH
MGGLLHKLRCPPRSYVICAVPRSGSNLLGDGLADTQEAGRPKQYFLPEFEERYATRYGFDPANDYAGYLRGVISATQTRNNIFGFKLMSFYFDEFLGRLRATGAFADESTSDVDLLRAAFSQLQFIHLIRGDKLRQAISRARAMQTGVWKIAGSLQPIREPHYDAQLIVRCLRDGEREEAIWTRFFCAARLKPLTVNYESLSQAYIETLRGVLEFIGAGRVENEAIATPRTIRQGDEISDEWYCRFRRRMAEAGAWSVVVLVAQFAGDVMDLVAWFAC